MKLGCRALCGSGWDKIRGCLFVATGVVWQLPQGQDWRDPPNRSGGEAVARSGTRSANEFANETKRDGGDAA